MGLLDFFSRSSRDSKRPETPYEAARLVNRHIDSERYDQALEVAEDGLRRFPESEAVLDAYRYLKKRTEKETIAELKNALERQSHPVKYAQLADIYRDMGDLDRAIEVAREGIEEFPDHEGNYIILAKIRLERFREDYIPKDGLYAIEYLQTARDYNRNSYKTLIQLAELYLEIGAREHAIEVCEDILYFAPEDDRALHLLRQAQNLETLDREDVEALLKEYADEQRVNLESRQTRTGAKAQSVMGPLMKRPAELTDRLRSAFFDVPGFHSSIALDAEGRPIASVVDDGADEAELSQAFETVFNAGQDCSLRMDIGGFKEGMVEGPSGTVHLFTFESVNFATIFGPEAKKGRIQEAAEMLLEHELYLPFQEEAS